MGEVAHRFHHHVQRSKLTGEEVTATAPYFLMRSMETAHLVIVAVAELSTVERRDEYYLIFQLVTSYSSRG
jgi:hypothetical protein